MADTGLKSSRAKPYLALSLLAFIWGLSFLFIKYAVDDMSPPMLALLRSATGLAALYAALLAMRRLPDPALIRRHWRDFAFVAVAGGLVPWTALAWGELSIPTGVTSILNATTPLFTVVIATAVLHTERPARAAYAGVALGLVGTVILLAPEVLKAGFGGSFVGMLAVIGAALSYAVSALYIRRRLQGVDAFQAAAGQLLLTVLVAIPFALAGASQSHFEIRGVLALLALGIGGTGLAYLLYFYLLRTLGATGATAVTFLLPVTAVVWGIVFLNETLTVPIALGMVVILSGIVLTSRRPAPARA